MSCEVTLLTPGVSPFLDTRQLYVFEVKIKSRSKVLLVSARFALAVSRGQLLILSEIRAAFLFHSDLSLRTAFKHG